MALGAQRDAITRMVVWQGMRIAGAGMLLGTIAALGLVRLMTSLLYETSATDPLTFALVTAILALAALLACFQPAFLAARADPMAALRHE